MSFLPEAQLPDTFPPYETFLRSLGFVPSLFRAQGLVPRVVEAQAAIRSALIVEPGALSRVLKEKILLAAAGARGNPYCRTLRRRVLDLLDVESAAIEALDSGKSAAGDEAEAALVDFCRKLCARPDAIGVEDVEGLRHLGLSDLEILEAILTTGYGELLCVMASGIGATPNSEQASILTAAPPAPATPQPAPIPAPQGRQLHAPEAGPADLPAFAVLQKRFGFVPRVYRAQTLKPRAIEAEVLALEKILFPEDLLTRRQKELVLLAVSAAHRNAYFVAVHGRVAQMLGVPAELADRIASDDRLADLPDAERALLDAARRLAADPDRYGASDVDSLRRAGFGDEQILEAVAVAALTTFLNTVQAGLGAAPDFRPRIEFAADHPKMNLSGAGTRPTGDAERTREPATDPDAELVARARGGDMSAFEALVRGHQGRVYRTLMGITGSPQDAEDGSQAVFIKVFRKIGEFGGDARFSTWLTRIAINEGLERLRSRKPVESLDDDAFEEDFRPSNLQPWLEDPESRFAREEMRRIVEEAVARLPAPYRTALLLRDFQELSGAEAAEALGIPLPTLKTRLLRGRLMLREALAPFMTQPRRAANV